MKINDIVEIYPYGYDEDTRIRFRRIAIVTNTSTDNKYVHVKYTDKEREEVIGERDSTVRDAYRFNKNKHVWYHIMVIK